jgi:hypothetical protein
MAANLKCQKHLVAPGKCQRKSKFVRITSNGHTIRLCPKCDEAIGETVGIRKDHYVGDDVMVYKDPLTREIPEGRAIIKEIHRWEVYDGAKALDCWVNFVDDPDQHDYFRVIAYL